MKRRLLNLLTILSLVLCAAVMALWVRSRVLQHMDGVSWDGRHSSDSILSVRGKLFFHHVTWDRRWWPPRRRLWRTHDVDIVDLTPASPMYWLASGLGVGRTHGVSRTGASQGIGYTETWVVVPAWLAAATGAALPLAWAYRRASAARRRRPGQCRVCGYDLRATPEKCPECGTVPAMTKESGMIALRFPLPRNSVRNRAPFT